MIRHICLFGLGLILALSPNTSLKADVIIDGDVTDQAIQSTVAGAQGGGFLNQNFGGQQLRIGRFSTLGGTNVATVLVFELPDLGTTADPFETANLDFTLIGIDTAPAGTPVPDYDIDLYGIDRRERLPAPATGNDFQVVFDDFYAGPDVDPNATLLEDSIITPLDAAVPNQRFSSGDISDYLNAQYAGGDGVGDLVFLRLNPTLDPDVIVDNQSGYLIASANNNIADLRPVINFTTAVPEPSSVAILLLGVSVISTRRRRSR